MMHNDATPMSADLCTADGLGICYVTDENFLFPTLLSLISLRRFVPVDVAPVFVVIFGAESIDLRSIKGAVRHLGATLIDATHREIPGMSDFDWSTTHVTAASIGRFLLDGLLPPGVRRILYIDGDTMVVGSLAPLLNYRPPEGAFAAADDAISLYRSDGSANGRSTRAYFSGIGLRIDQCYFNAGIFLVERNTWATITEKALAFLLVHPERCIYRKRRSAPTFWGL